MHFDICGWCNRRTWIWQVSLRWRIRNFSTTSSAAPVTCSNFTFYVFEAATLHSWGSINLTAQFIWCDITFLSKFHQSLHDLWFTTAYCVNVITNKSMIDRCDNEQTNWALWYHECIHPIWITVGIALHSGSISVQPGSYIFTLLSLKNIPLCFPFFTMGVVL